MSTGRVRKQDAYLALERLENYRGRLNRAEDEELKKALDRAIAAIRTKLFQALLDVQEFYVGTLDASLPESQKALMTEQLANQWERHSPIPVQDRASEIDSNENATEETRMEEYVAPTVESDAVKPPTNHVAPPEDEIETIVLQKGDSGLGFSISGGVDNHHIVDDPGVFVTKILPGLPAEMDGRLKMDDQLLSVNGNSMGGVSHGQAVQALKDAGSTVVLVVRHGVGLATSRSVTPHARTPPPLSPELPFITVVLNKVPGKGLGFSIAGGKDNMHVEGDDGIFITKIIPGGAADADGTLSVGDRVIKVDDHSMVGIFHSDAVSILKSTLGRVVLQLEKGALQNMGITPEPSSVAVHPEEQGGTPAFTVDVQVTQAVEIEPYKMRKVTFERPEGTGLGFNIIGGEENFGIYVSFVTAGGIADKSELVRVGDQILEVNGVDLRNMTHEAAAKTLKASGTVVELLLEYRPQEYTTFQQEVENFKEQLPPPTPTSPGIVTTEKRSFYIRALHDFEATTDSTAPQSCLSFKQGDIIHVLIAGNEEWWQAAIVNARLEDGPPGLIPSRRRMEKRLSKQKSVNFPKKSDSGGEVGNERGDRRRRSFKFSKKFPFVKGNKDEEDAGAEGGEGQAGPVYEAVQLQEKGQCRPVIILGPLKDEVNDMLVQEFPDEFAGCVPHTTRAPRPGEVDGRDYHFVSSVDQMESDIQAHLFIEAGRYKDNLYGTSIKAVKDVAEQGKHCILGVSGFAIRRLLAANLQPIAICIRPNSAQTIQEIMSRSGLTLEKAQEDFEKGLKVEQDFAEYFTAVIEGGSLSEIYEKVKHTINEQSGQHVWLPSDEPI